MSADRFVVLGLATGRAGWFTDLARWSTSGSVPVEFLKCLSTSELLARVSSGRPASAVLLDGGLPGLDRDLLAAAGAGGAAVIVIDDRARRGWTALGAASVLPATFDREVLLHALRAHSRPVTDVRRSVELDLPGPAPEATGAIVAICGPGGTGATSTAAALAQGAVGELGRVVLADLARHAQQAVLHDVGEVAPGWPELVEAHRSGWPSTTDVESGTWQLADRGYRLLLGLRRPRHWTTLRPRAVEAAVDGLRRAFDLVVCDVDADLDGDEQASPDVADRNSVARAVHRRADLVLVVGRPGAKGTHALLRVLAELGAGGVPPDRVVPVVVGAPRQPRARADQVRAIAELAATAAGGPTSAVLLLPERKVELAWRDAAPMPAPLPAMLAGAVTSLLERLGRRDGSSDDPELVRPGSLGTVAELG